MAIGVRDITNLEELLEVQDDDKIIVIQNGEAKLISKANAKFGGGTATVFYGETPPSSSEFIRLVDINRNPIGAQAAYDAVMSGPVHAFQLRESIGNKSIEYFASLNLEFVIRENENVISIAFKGFSDTRTYNFYAGQNPNTIGGGPN